MLDKTSLQPPHSKTAKKTRQGHTAATAEKKNDDYDVGAWWDIGGGGGGGGVKKRFVLIM